MSGQLALCREIHREMGYSSVPVAKTGKGPAASEKPSSRDRNQLFQYSRCDRFFQNIFVPISLYVMRSTTTVQHGGVAIMGSSLPIGLPEYFSFAKDLKNRVCPALDHRQPAEPWGFHPFPGQIDTPC